MPSDWQYKLVGIPVKTIAHIVENNVNGMSVKEGSTPRELTLHTEPEGELYAYVYQVPAEQIQEYAEEIVSEGWKFGALLKHKPGTESRKTPSTAADASTRVGGDITTELSKEDGEDLLQWLRTNSHTRM